MDARKHQVLTLTTTGGSISHTDAEGKTVSAIYVGNLVDPCIHIYDISGDTIKIWGTNESNPADTTNAIQLGSDITADTLLVLERGPLYIFIEFDADGGGDPYAIITGRVE